MWTPREDLEGIFVRPDVLGSVARVCVLRSDGAIRVAGASNESNRGRSIAVRGIRLSLSPIVSSFGMLTGSREYVRYSIPR